MEVGHKRSFFPQVYHTGLFVPVDKTTFFLGTASPSLKRICNVRAVIGPKQQDDQCEILLLPTMPTSSNSCGENYEKAKTILKNFYLNLLVKENTKCNDKTLGDCHKKDCSKAMNVNNRKCNNIKGKLEHDGIKEDIYNTRVNNLTNMSQDRSVKILSSTTIITVKNTNTAPMKFSAVQSPAVSGTDDVEIVDLIADSPNLSQIKMDLENKRDIDRLDVISEKKQRSDNKDGILDVMNYCEPTEICDEDDDILYVTSTNSQDVIDIDDEDISNVSINNCLSGGYDNTGTNNKEDLVLLSEDDCSKKSDITGNRKKLKLGSKMRLSNKRKKRVAAFSMRISSNSLSGHNNYHDGDRNIKADNISKASESAVVGQTDNVCKLITNTEDGLKNLSFTDDVKKSDGSNNDVTTESDSEDLSVIEVDFSKHKEIILISENEEDNDVQNDIENDKNDNNNKSCMKAEKTSKKKKRICLSKRKLSKLTKEELIKKGYAINPNIYVPKLHSVKNKNRTLHGNQSNDDQVNSVLNNLQWSRPAHFNSIPVMPGVANSAQPPLVVRNLSTDVTLNRKRKASQPSDCSPSKKPVNAGNVGSNVCIPQDGTKKIGLRPVVIDASNVAFSHGRNEDFSAKGIEICINYFKTRGHQVVAVLPNFRKGFIDSKLLHQWERDGLLAVTPSRKVNGQLVISHDDRYIIQVAAALGGVIVSQDHYRDFIGKNKLWDEAIEKRLLMFTWVGDLLMFPEDPLGRNGPILNDFLRFPSSIETTTTS